jgi:hypothetical protein
VSKPSYGQARVEGAKDFQGLRLDHPTLTAYVKKGIRLGWGNERLCKVVGVPPSFVDRLREHIRKESQATG